MVAPIVTGLATSALSGVVAEVGKALLEALPWFSSGSASAERNIKLAQTVGPKLIELAQTATGQSGMVEAAQAVRAGGEAQAKFVALVAPQWKDIEPQLRFDEESRQAARSWVAGYRQEKTLKDGLTFVELLSLIFVFFSALGGAWVLYGSDFPAEIKGSVITLMLIGGWTGVQAFWMGSSDGSRRKDAVVQGR